MDTATSYVAVLPSDKKEAEEFKKMLKEADPGLPYFNNRCLTCNLWMDERTQNNLCPICTDKYER